MGTANYDIYDLLKENLMTRDDAVVGEAAGLAMGLVMIGTKSTDSLEDMLNVRPIYLFIDIVGHAECETNLVMYSGHR